MAKTGSYDVNTAHRDRDAEIARLAAQARVGWEKEASALEAHGFRDGMSILELGSGPGFVTRLLLDRFPSSHVTAVELDAALIDDARRHLGAHAERVTFVEGSVEDTGLPPDAFDAAFARFLFQHLPDPIAAAREVHRVLRPGGTFVIGDVDDELWGTTNPPVPGIRLVMERMGALQTARGGDRHIGRRLAAILREAGFASIDVDIVAKDTEAFGLDAFLAMFDPGQLVPLVANGVLTQQELEELEEQRQAFLAAERPYILALSFMARGRKPDRP